MSDNTDTLQKLASARKDELSQLSSTLVSAIALGRGTLLSTGAFDAYRNRKP